MRAADYDAWHDTPRGRWIGDAECRLVSGLLGAPSTVLDVGCGTGWFTRRLAADGARVTGQDPDEEALAFARHTNGGRVAYVRGDALCLPFADGAFDAVVSVTALCFIEHWERAIGEIVRCPAPRRRSGSTTSSASRTTSRRPPAVEPDQGSRSCWWSDVPSRSLAMSTTARAEAPPRRLALVNAQIGAALDEIADLLEIGGANPFRVRAYRGAARTIGTLGARACRRWKRPRSTRCPASAPIWPPRSMRWRPPGAATCSRSCARKRRRRSPSS